MHSHRILCVALLCALAVLAATASQAAQPGPPAKVSMVAGNGEIVQTSVPAPVPMTIQVTDAAGIPVAGVPVGWTVSCAPGDYGCDSQQNTGTLMQPTSQTDSMGIASTGYNQSYVPSGLSFTQSTVTATTSVGMANFKITTTPFTVTTLALDAFINKPGPLGTVTGPAGSTMPGALQVSVNPGAGFSVGQGIPNVGVRIVDGSTFMPTSAASCNAPAGTVLTDASGKASCDIVLGNVTPGTYTVAAKVGEDLNPPFYVTITSAQLCTYSISPQSASYPAQGGTGLINVTADPGCTWTIMTSGSFITIAPGASGVGNGIVNYTVGTNNGAARSGTITIAGQTFTVNQGGIAAGPLTITSSANLSGGAQGVAYSTAPLTASGGTGTYGWIVSAGSLPPGLTLTTVNNTGVISGVPTTAGNYPFTITVTDSGGASQSQAVSISVAAAGAGLMILTTSVPNGTVGTPYTAPLSFSPPNVNCGSPFTSFAFAVASGSLPPGLSIQGNSIAGTPTSPGSFPFTLIVVNGSCQSPPAAFTIVISGAPAPTVLNANPSSLTFSVAQNGAAPAAQLVGISSTGSSVSITASPNVGWLSVALNQNFTPATLTVSVVNFQSLAPGGYAGAITIAAPGNNFLTIPVALNISAGPPPVGLSVTATSLTFALPTNSFSQQVITVLGSTGNPTVSFLATATTSTGTPWLGLVVTPGSAPTTAISSTTPANLGVTVSTAGLPPGKYTGSVIIQQQATNLSLTLPVTMTVGQTTLTVDSQSLAFTFVPGVTPPAAQTINVFSNTQVAITVTTTTAAGGNWLFTTVAGGVTPTAITVTVNPAGLMRGTFNGMVIITPQDPSIPPVQIPIILTIGAGPGPVINGVVNAASNAPGPVAPGEFVAIYGTALGSTTPSLLTLTASGTIATTLNSTQVLFDGLPAALVFVSAAQINAIVPYEIFGRARTQVQVQYNGALSSPVDLAVGASAPGIFLCLDCQPANQAAALNQDNTPNSATNGALPGSVVTLFATGEGQTDPPGTTGAIVGTTLAKPLLPVSVRIGGLPAQLNYYGSAPSLAEGVLQVNAVVPAGVPRGVPVDVTLTIGDATSNTAKIAIAP